jgi:hypothetical protein
VTHGVVALAFVALAVVTLVVVTLGVEVLAGFGGLGVVWVPGLSLCVGDRVVDCDWGCGVEEACCGVDDGFFDF